MRDIIEESTFKKEFKQLKKKYKNLDKDYKNFLKVFNSDLFNSQVKEKSKTLSIPNSNLNFYKLIKFRSLDLNKSNGLRIICCENNNIFYFLRIYLKNHNKDNILEDKITKAICAEFHKKYFQEIAK